MKHKRHHVPDSKFDGDLPPLQDAKSLAAKYSDQANAHFKKLEDEIRDQRDAAAR